MAEPTAPTAPQTSAAVTERSTAHQLSALSDFLKRYSPSYIEPARDTLDGRWRIDLAKPLPEFDTRTARAYTAMDLIHPDKKLYALVCRPGTYQRHRIIPALKLLRHPNILPLMAAGVVELSQPHEERFAIFYERPAGKRISELLAETKGELNEAFLVKNIVGPIVSAIHELSLNNVTHGRINLDNIYYHNTPVLGDCVSEPCGYSQPFVYESLERIQALPAAKGEGSSSMDYYAMAILVLFLQHGTKHFAEWTQESLIRAILREGGYNALIRDKESSAAFEELFRSLLMQNIDDRWDYTYLKQWIDGKRFNVLVPPLPTEAMRPFEFGGSQATTKRELAHVFYMNWNALPEILSSGQLVQWIVISLRNKELAENVTRISNAIREINTKNSVQLNEQLMRLLLLFDPAGPVRFHPLSMHVDGIDALYAELFANKSETELQLIAKYIEFNMVSFWLDHQRKDSEYVSSPAVNNILTKLERLRISIRSGGLGFGLERALYDLNPDMPCLSPMLSSYHVSNLASLLKRLDRLAPNLANGQDPIDKHIAAFIASKLNIQHEIKLHELATMPVLANNKAIFALKLLAGAQQRNLDAPLPGLTHWIGARILPALETLHSRTLRNTLISMLTQRIETGSLPFMAELVIDSNYAVADQDGYTRAIQTYNANTAHIASLRKNEGIEERSGRLGYGIAKIMASAAFVMTLFSVVREIGN